MVASLKRYYLEYLGVAAGALLAAASIFTAIDLGVKFLHLAAFVVGVAIVMAMLFLVLLAMPKSRVRLILLEVVSWFAAAGAIAFVISPLDFLPDPAFVDDLIYLFVAILAGTFAYRTREDRRRLAGR